MLRTSRRWFCLCLEPLELPLADIVSAVTRSRMMSSIRGRDTRPELAVRSYLHGQGLRFRLHEATLPGRPDLVFRRFNAVVFVHGCFWHRHHGCRYAYTPQSNRAFWQSKLAATVNRDRRNVHKLETAGWRVLVIWECELGQARLAALTRAIRKGPLSHRRKSLDKIGW